MSGSVLLLNADRSVLCFVPWQRAVSLLLSSDKSGTPMASIFEADPEKFVRSPSVTVPMPRIVVLTRYLYLPHQHRSASQKRMVTRRGILERDKYTCAYCGRKGSTVDHVFPQSRGGKDTWENLVACCLSCNGIKDNRTPEEAGMRLRWQPYSPDPLASVQRQVWAAMAALEASSV